MLLKPTVGGGWNARCCCCWGAWNAFCDVVGGGGRENEENVLVGGLGFMDMFDMELLGFIDMVAMELFMAPREESDGAVALPQGIWFVVVGIKVLLEPQGLWAAAPQFTDVGCI